MLTNSVATVSDEFLSLLLFSDFFYFDFDWGKGDVDLEGDPTNTIRPWSQGDSSINSWRLLKSASYSLHVVIWLQLIEI